MLRHNFNGSVNVFKFFPVKDNIFYLNMQNFLKKASDFKSLFYKWLLKREKIKFKRTY